MPPVEREQGLSRFLSEGYSLVTSIGAFLLPEKMDDNDISGPIDSAQEVRTDIAELLCRVLSSLRRAIHDIHEEP